MTDELRAPAGDASAAPSAEGTAPPPPPAFDGAPRSFDPGAPVADAALPLPAPPSLDAPIAPAAWEAPIQPDPRLVDGSRPWGMTDPGPIADGAWQSPGYGSSVTRANILRVLILAGLATSAATVVLEVWSVRLLQQVAAGDIALAEAAPVAGFFGLVSLAGVVVSFGMVAMLIAWTGRVVDNIPPLTGRTPERGPQLSMWSWILPLANWVLPYLAVRDALWRLRESPSDRVPAWLVPWWLIRVGGGLVSLTLALGARGATIDQLLPAQVATMLLSMVASIGDFAVVTAVTRRENAQAANLGLLGGTGRRWPAFVPGWGGASDETDEDEFIDDDPLSRQPGESEEDHRDRLLATLEAEAVRR